MPTFEVTYTPLSVVERAARKAGMKDGDNTSLWDWVQDGDHVHAAGRYSSLRSAAVHAKSLVPLDVCGEVRVCQVARIKPRGAPPYWADLAVWHVYDDVDPEALTEDAPDHRCEPDWSEQDAVCA